MNKIIILILLTASMSFSKHERVSSEDKALLWAEEKVSKMTLDEMIGQLFMIRAHSDLGNDHIKDVERQIKEYKVGGLCFFQGTPTKQAELTNKYQKLANVPLFISMDGEWGLGMRFKEKAISYPKQLTLGALKHNDVIYEMGQEIAAQFKRIGVHINFAPVVDVNNNAKNPVIHTRSFGEDIYNVSAKAYAYMKGMQDAGMIACAKHFPGHGDTDVDSHYDLPVLNFSKERLDSLELMPFKTISQMGIKSIMTAHLQVPALDDRSNRPSTLSENIISGVLKSEIGFDGLIFTDAMEMKGVAKHYNSAESTIEALRAGNDMILLPPDMDLAFKGVQDALKNGEIDSIFVANKVRKILKHKHLIGLTNTPIISNLSDIATDVNANKSIALKSKLYEQAITLVKKDNYELPIAQLQNQKIAVLSLGTKEVTPFQKRMKSYTHVDNITADENISADQQSRIKKQLAYHDVVFISLHDMSKYASKNYGISKDQMDLIFTINSQNKVVLVNFGTPYALQYFNNVPNIVQAYEEDELCQDVAAQTIMGANAFRGSLPVTVNEDMPYRTGIATPDLGRIKYGVPEKVGISSDTLLKIDEIVDEMIKEKAAPGCQILAIKDGQVVFEKAYGYHTFNKKRKVQLDHIYDVASVTKILATTISLMKLEESKIIGLDKSFDLYLPEIDTSNKGDLIIQDVLAHHGRLPGWIPFYEQTLEEDEKTKKAKLSEKYYRTVQSDSFCTEVIKDVYLRCDYQDSIYSRIYGCKLRDQNNYRYSDLGFYLFHQVITRMTGQRLDEYTKNTFYNQLSFNRTGFNPYKNYDQALIVPSEDDTYFRNTVVQGYVHDMGSAMLGGVSGHAGLFSNAQELGILMQMLLNGGSYGGKQFLEPTTIRKYTTRYPLSTRRGLGFDMKELDEDKTLNMSELASDSAFGHLGFTGTAVFADPETNLVYVFLSNRTFPTMKNSKFGKNEYRPRVQSVFYNAMMD